MSKVIRVIWNEETGERTILTEGFTGPECIKESQFIKDYLGRKVDDPANINHTKEYYKKKSPEKVKSAVRESQKERS